MKTTKAFDKEFSGYDAATADQATKDRYDKLINSGEAYRCARFEFGAQLKVDIKVNINDNFAYTTQIVLFEDYLKNLVHVSTGTTALTGRLPNISLSPSPPTSSMMIW